MAMNNEELGDSVPSNLFVELTSLAELSFPTTASSRIKVSFFRKLFIYSFFYNQIFINIFLVHLRQCIAAYFGSRFLERYSLLIFALCGQEPEKFMQCTRSSDTLSGKRIFLILGR